MLTMPSSGCPGGCHDRPLPRLAGLVVAVLPRPHLHRDRLGPALVVLRMPPEAVVSMIDLLLWVSIALIAAGLTISTMAGSRGPRITVMCRICGHHYPSTEGLRRHIDWEHPCVCPTGPHLPSCPRRGHDV